MEVAIIRRHSLASDEKYGCRNKERTTHSQQALHRFDACQSYSFARLYEVRLPVAGLDDAQART